LAAATVADDPTVGPCFITSEWFTGVATLEGVVVGWVPSELVEGLRWDGPAPVEVAEQVGGIGDVDEAIVIDVRDVFAFWPLFAQVQVVHQRLRIGEIDHGVVVDISPGELEVRRVEWSASYGDVCKQDEGK